MNLFKQIVYCIFCIVLFAFPVTIQPLRASGTIPAERVYAAHPGENAHNLLDEMEPVIRKRIENLVTIVDPVYNPYVRSYLNTYIERSPQKTEEILGRTVIYFPLFEKVLAEYGLPEELKFLAIIESALLQEVKSRAGAAGIWQFMPPTGRYYGLSISSYVDERLDPELATRSAIRYLRDLYKRFGSWELAMAAYNAGPGRVNSAIRRSGTRNYWKLAHLLPRETRAYVPGFIAAMYVYYHHEQHGLELRPPTDDFIYTSKVRIHKAMSFKLISEVTGVPVSYLKSMNAKFVRNYIPNSLNGYDVLVPSYATDYLLQYLDRPDAVAIPYKNFNPILVDGAIYEERESMYVYRVEKGDNLYNLARENSCSISDIKQWNGLTSNNIQIGQPLNFYYREMVLVQPKRRSVYVVSPLNRQFQTGSFSEPGNTLDLPRRRMDHPQYITNGTRMVVRRRHSLRTQLIVNRVAGSDDCSGLQDNVDFNTISAGKVIPLK